MSKKISIMLFAHDVVDRQMIINLLKNEPDIHLQTVTDESGLVSPENLQHADAVLMDLPGTDSKEMSLFRQIRTIRPDLPIVVLNPLNETGAMAAITALREGAVEYITVPEKDEAMVFARRHLKKRLVPAVKSIRYLNVRSISYKKEAFIFPPPAPSNKLIGKVPVDLVALGGDTGGILSLFKLIESMPLNLPVPIVIVQHMPKIYTSVLAKMLAGETGQPVREIVHGTLIKPGMIYLAPGGFHTVTGRDGTLRYFHLHRGPREHEFRPSIDVTLRSLSSEYGDRLLSVILSGGDIDGVNGVRTVINGGGQTIVQDRDTSLLWHLPGLAFRQSQSITAVPLKRISSEIVRRIILKRSTAPKADLAKEELREYDKKMPD